MTNKNQLLVRFILDRSGSMNPIWSDVLGGFNQYVEDRVNDAADTWLTLTTFDTEVETPYTAWKVEDFPKLTKEIVSPRGATALLDAVGKSITTTEEWLENNKDWFDGRIILVIFTDGYENSSVEWTKEMVSSKISEKEAEGWSIVYLGANQNSWAEASKIGISVAGNTANWAATPEGTKSAFRGASTGTTAYASTGTYQHGS